MYKKFLNGINLNSLVVYFNSLQQRERLILIIGIYLTILIVGLGFIAYPLFKETRDIDKKINKELKNYRELTKLASEYISIKPKKSPSFKLSLSQIESLALQVGIKENIRTLKNFKNNGVELFLENVQGDKVFIFLKELNKNEIKILSLSIDKLPDSNYNYNVHIILTK